MGEQVDARTAAERLGVDVRTLYAYVSRGALRRVPGPDGRSSRYDSDELQLLARRSRPRTLPRPAASIDLVVATRVSTVTDGAVRYRGRDVLGLVADGEQFEAVAELLWAGPPATAAGVAASRRPGVVASAGARRAWRRPARSHAVRGRRRGHGRRRRPRCRRPTGLAGLGQVPDRDPRRGVRSGAGRALTRMARSHGGCGGGGHRCLPPPPGSAPSIPRSSCSPSTSSPPPPWRSGSRRPRGPRRPAVCSPGSAR